MATQETQRVTQSYYFNPLTQTYSDTSGEEPYAYIKLTTPKELPLAKLKEIIQQLGNYMAIMSVRLSSSETEHNYCTDYTWHISTCKQARWCFCKRHLTEKEMKECSEIERRLDPQHLTKGVIYDANCQYIPRGEVALMRQILICVRHAIQ
jgi:hypothetical protein